ncbi:MAG: glycosyltransferase [Bryobacterales bacterium]|nr:glycosyltransferase [Bryobacterales bacterium]
MHILHLDTGREMSGGQWQALRLMERTGGTLLARGGSPLMEEAHRRGVEAFPLTIPRLVRLVRETQIVHAHDARSHTMAALAFPAKLVVSRRVAFPIRMNPASRWKYASATHYIAVSEHVKGMLLQARIPARKITVVGDGVPLCGFRLHPGGRILVNDPRKHAGLAQAAARELGVEVHTVKNLERDLKDASLFVYVSHSEGLGSGALLAMAAGVPVVASNVGGLPEIVRDGETGLLAANNTASIAVAIRRMLDDRPFAEACAARARSMVEERFSVDAMVQNTMKVYRRILK